MLEGQNRFDEARKFAEEASMIWKDTENRKDVEPEGPAEALRILGSIACIQKQHRKGSVYFAECLREYCDIGFKGGVLCVLVYLSKALWFQGRFVHSARLFGALSALSRSAEFRDAFQKQEIEQIMAARLWVGWWLPLAWKSGSRMTFEETIRFAQESVRIDRK